MKKLVSITSLSLLLAGCATHTQSVTAPDGTKTVTKDKTSDNAALTFIGQSMKLGGDIVTAVLPPFIPLIVGNLTSPVVSTNK